MKKILFCIILLLPAFGWGQKESTTVPEATSQEVYPAIGEAKILVASRLLRGHYEKRVLLVKSFLDGRSVGVILNIPLKQTLADFFPNHAPSLKARNRIFLGGPANQKFVFAVVRRKENPGDGSLRLSDEIFLAAKANVVDKLIEDESANTKFFAGLVIWKPGELEIEIRDRMWHQLKAKPEIIFKGDSSEMWEELMKSIERKLNST